jgi:hypothetical protein
MRCDSLHKHIAVKLLHLVYCKKGKKRAAELDGLSDVPHSQGTNAALR